MSAIDWFILLSGILNLFLGAIILLQNPSAWLNRGFGLFALSTTVYIFIDFLFRLTPSLIILQSAYAAALLVPASATIWILEFCHKPMSKLSYFSQFVLISAPIVFIGITFTPGALILHVDQLTTLGYKGALGPLFPLYGLYFFLYIIFFSSVLLEARQSADPVYRHQLNFIFAGVASYGAVASITSLVLPQVFGIFNLTLFDAPSLLLFVGCTFYAILKFELFNTKVFAAELFIVLLSCFVFIRILLANSLQDRFADAVLLIVTVVIGIFFIRSVLREVRQRELIEAQEKELQIVNKQQENLLHFISHEVKGYLTAGESGFASIVEGDFGAASPQLVDMSKAALAKMRAGVSTVMDILDAANMKKGTVQYLKKDFDLAEMISGQCADLIQVGKAKGLQVTCDLPKQPLRVLGDEAKLRRHVIRNLVDNSLKYTERGTIHVALSRQNGTIRFSVEDTGIGITHEDMKNLFTAGGKGKDSTKVNADSTGYGLFVAKSVVEAHGGKIWAESEGQGKGSRFVVELPVAS